MAHNFRAHDAQTALGLQAFAEASQGDVSARAGQTDPRIQGRQLCVSRSRVAATGPRVGAPPLRAGVSHSDQGAVGEAIGKAHEPAAANRQELNHALVALGRAADCRIGYLMFDYLSQASEHLGAAGMPDLALRAEMMIHDFGCDIEALIAAVEAAKAGFSQDAVLREIRP